MDVFDLSASLTLDTSDYENQLGKAAKSTDDFTGSTGGASSGVSMLDIALGGLVAHGAMAAINALADLTKQVIGLGDNIDKNSQRANMSTSSYQEWAHVLELGGGRAESLTSATRTMSSVLMEAANGSENANEKLNAIGLTYQELAGMSAEQQFEAVVYALADMEAGAERTALAQQLLGRAGMDMIPTLNQGREAIAAQRQEAQDLGLILSEDAVKASAQLTDAMTNLSAAFMGAAGNIAGSILPALTDVVTGFTDLVRGVEGAEADIVSGVVGLVEGVATIIANGLPKILSAAGKLFGGLVDALPEIQSRLIAALPDVILAIGTFLIENTPKVISATLEMGWNTIKAIPQIIPALIDVMNQLLKTLVNTIIGWGKQIYNSALDAGKNIIRGIKAGLTGSGSDVVVDVVAVVEEVAPALEDAVTGIVTVVEDAVTDVGMAAEEVAPALEDAVIDAATAVEEEAPALETATKSVVQRAATAATTTAKTQGTIAGTTLAKAITDPILRPQDATAQNYLNNLRTAIETVARRSNISLDMNLETGTLDSLGGAYGSSLVDKIISSMITGWDNGVPVWAEHVNTNFGSIGEIIENHLKEYFGFEGVIQEVPQHVNAYMQALNTAFQQAGTMGALQGQGVDMGIFAGLDMTQGQNSQLFTQVEQMLQQIVALGGGKGAEMANALLEQLITVTDEGLIEVNELTLERYTELIEQLREQQEEAQQESISSTTDYAGTVVNNIGVLFQSGGEGWKSLLLNYGTQIGKNMLAGMRSGIENDWGPFEGWLTSLMQSLISSISKLFGIFSPSTVFAGIGENLILGLQEGVADTFAPFERSTLADMQGFADSAANVLSGASAGTRRIGWADSVVSHVLESSNIGFGDSIMKGMRDFQGQMTAEMLNAISASQSSNGGGRFHATIELGGAEVGEQVFNLNREHIRSISTSRDAMASTILRS